MNKEVKNKIWKLLDSKRGSQPIDTFLDLEFVKSIIDTNNLDKEETDALEEILLSIQRNKIGEYVTPSNLVTFLTKIIKPKDSDVILDPVCGTGSFLKELYKQNSRANYYGIDINASIIDWAEEFAKQREQNINYHNQDSLREFPNDIPNANFIFANLPFGAKVHDKDLISKYNVQSRELDILLIQKIINSLTPDGIAFVIVTESLLFRKNAEKLRDYISKEAFLDAIISLPAGTFAPYTSIKTSVLVISKRKNNTTALYEIENIRQDSKVIEDLQSHLIGKQIAFGEVVEDYTKRANWSVTQYHSETKRKELLDSIPHSYELKKIKDFCEVKSLSPKEINKEDIDLIISSTYVPGKVLEKEDIEGKSDKAKYFTLQITNRKISKDYIRALLSSRFADLESLLTGMTIKTLKKSDLEEFELPIVNEDIQNELVITLSNLEAVKDKVAGFITEIEKVENGNIFKINYDPEIGLSKLANQPKEYQDSLPKPMAMSYYSYKNTKNVDKKFENIRTSFSIIIKTLGFISLLGLSTINDKKLPETIRKEVDPSRKLTDGVWGKLIQLAVKKSCDMTCFLSEEMKYINSKEIHKIINDLTKSRNERAHPANFYSTNQKKAFTTVFQNDLERLLDMFSFLTAAPLVYFEKTEKFPPQKIVHTVKYLVGDDMHDKEYNIELREDFYQTLYLLKNVPNKSISMYPLMIYEDSIESESKDIFLFGGLDKREDPYYLSLTKGEKIVREEYRDDVHRIFYYIPEK